MDVPPCSIIVVNFNGKKHLDACLAAFEKLDYPPERMELLLVDNGSEDGSETEAAARHPQVRLLRNPQNNFAAALNLGVRESRGEYIVFANNDVFVEPNWLKELVWVLEANPRGGCAGGKLLFENGRLNSVWHRALPDFYWEDEGFNQEDQGQYDRPREVEGLCWAAVLFRRACLENIGPIDEDYVLYYEDVDTARRCRERGWKILYVPQARATHVFHGAGQSNSLTEYFCDRGRLIYVAKFHLEKLAEAVKTSRFLARDDRESLYETLPAVLKKVLELHPPEVTERVLNELCEVLVLLYGPLTVGHLLARMQVILGQRPLRVGFYDQAGHVIGGGQRYGCTMAAALQDKYDVTLIVNRPVPREDLENWYRLPLARCRLKVVPLPFFDRFGSWIDSNVVTPDVPNPFGRITAESRFYDVFVNVNMLTMVQPLAPFSIFLCHFPDTLRRCYFAVEQYSCLVVNSKYTAEWVRPLWGLEPTLLLYPPVAMEAPPMPKRNIILSVARFEPGGTKKQHELIRAFEQLHTDEPELRRGWRLVLVGGSLPQNPYLEEIQQQARQSRAPVEVRVNVPAAELQQWYARAKIFWHACGLGEKDPHLVEHFGMTTVEAMQNRCLPIVINGGGQREIVEHGESGYRFGTLTELLGYTREVIAAPERMTEMQEKAYQRAQTFTRQQFEDFVRAFFAALAEEYGSVPRPDPREILRRGRQASLFFSPTARRLSPLGPGLAVRA